MVTSLELGAEQIKDFGNLRMELLKCFYNGQSVAESYINGNTLLHVHGLTRNYPFCATIRNLIDYRSSNDGEFSMFVGIGDFLENLRPCASIARLKLADDCDVGIIDTGEMDTFSAGVSIANSANKNLAFILDRKLCALYDLLGIKACQLINQIIKGSTEIIDDFPYQNRDNGGRRSKFERQIALDSHNLSTIFEDDFGWFSINGNVILYNPPKNINPLFQVRQVCACPSNPLISAIQRLHMLYYTHGEEKDAKNSQRSRDTRAYKGRVHKEFRENHQEVTC